MQSFVRVLSAAPAPAAGAGSLHSFKLGRNTAAGNIGQFADGHGAIDVAAKEAAFAKGFFQKYLNMFPKNMAVPAGTATLIGAGIMLYVALAPAKNAGAPDTKARTPKWEKATEEYLKKQRVSPAHQRSG